MLPVLGATPAAILNRLILFQHPALQVGVPGEGVF